MASPGAQADEEIRRGLRETLDRIAGLANRDGRKKALAGATGSGVA